MDKISAKQLVKETLADSFNKERFVHLVKNILNEFEEKTFIYRGNTIPKAFQDSIKILERIGKYKNDDKKIDILIVQLKKVSSLERARSKQRNFISWYLKSRGNTLKDGALVAFVSPNKEDWRFSFVKMEYRFDEEKKKIKEDWTPARRYSFLVGKNENSHTAQSCLFPLLQTDDKNPTLEDLESAFSIEKVTKEFYEKYRELFYYLTDALEKVVKKDKKIRTDFVKKKVNCSDFSKKLLGQIVFLYFLQKKGWFGVKKGKGWGTGSKCFMRELFKKKHRVYKNFFNDILEPLFYEALRLEHTDDYYKHFDCRIPFLNGGLFDPIGNYDWVNTDILLPDSLFSNKNKTKEGDFGDGILDIFDRYNFTVKEDEPLEKEVAVDPEMLGKVFENLLEIKDRKSKGTYYTPREIVHYMCQESLINYLMEELKGKINREDIETLVKYGESAIENESQTASQNKETKRYSFKLPEKIRSQARLIDKKLMGIRICDPAVGSGAFPVGMMNEIIRVRNALTPFIKNKKERTSYHFKRHAIQYCLYGVDIDSGAIEIAKLRLWLSLVVDEEDRKIIQPLPNLDYKIVCGNSLLGVEKDLFNYEQFKKLEKLKPLYFNETSSSKKQKYKKQIDLLISELTRRHKVFDFEIYFSEVFQEKKGFDVVIANPPYLEEKDNKSKFELVKTTEWGQKWYQGKMNYWYFFICKGIDISRRQSGIITFIAKNNWTTNDGAKKMRNKVIKCSQILSLIDFGDFKIFNAGIQTMVMLFKSDSLLERYKFDYRRLIGKNTNIKDRDLLSVLKKEKISHGEYLNPEIIRHSCINKKLIFNSPEIGNILNKLSLKSKFRLTEQEVGKAIEYNMDCVKEKHIKTLGNKHKIGKGIFVLSNKEKKQLSLTQKELTLIKPYYTTRELFRWYGSIENKKWIIYTDSTFKNKNKIKDYPNIKQHLDQFKKIITSDNKPYGLHRARKESFFKGEKIISVRKCATPTFTYVDFDSYVSATFYVIKTNRINQKYLTGIFNSKLVAFWLRYKGKMQGSNYQIDKKPILSIPLVNPSEEKQKTLIKLVDTILSVTKVEDYLNNPAKQVSEYEKQIDQLVYKLYELTPEEIKIIEDT